MKKYRIFWTCILPEHLIAQYRLSFAACNFSYNLMSGCAFDKVYSSMPLYVGGEMSKEAFSDKRFELIYDRWRKAGKFKQNWQHSKNSSLCSSKYPRMHQYGSTT